MDYCSSCGDQLAGDPDFCSGCGEQIPSEEDSKDVVVNVQQSADHASSTAASSGDGTANADAATQTTGTDVAASAETQTGDSDSYTKEQYLQSAMLLGGGVGLVGAFFSYIIGYPKGFEWVELLTVLPYAIPFWWLGLMCVGIVAAFAVGFSSADYSSH